MNRRAHHFTRKQIAQLFLRAGGCCEVCGARLKTGEGDADHILPVELGGESELANAQLLCKPCHKDKSRGDIGRIRKSDRQRDKHTGAFQKGRRRSSIQSRGFSKAEPQRTASRPIEKGKK